MELHNYQQFNSNIRMLCTNVFVPITLLSKLPPANLTRIRTFISMNPPVIIQSISPEESLLAYLPQQQKKPYSPITKKKNNTSQTYITTISTIICMYQPMLVINWTSQKTFITHGTFEGSFTCMNFSDVVFQIRTDGIACLATLMRTRKWLNT